ncbi:Maf-like protein [Clostridium sp. UBA4548]|uniref:Maf-like protein n=1 Tax=Clostridium sp. UBA4548 TaxID=1946361 RepID=UPI0025C12240|nr:Maf-like protein [Clostridium sp. UBA4548]
MNIVLASASPRRQQLLGKLTKNFKILASNFDESTVKFHGNPCDYVCILAEEKVNDVLEQVNGEALVIGCDTIVFYNGKVLGKPKDEKEAFSMLRMLSNNVHHVYSSIVITNNITREVKKSCVCTEVKFMELNDEIISEYIKSGEPFDKAGAYGIQGNGAIFVERINGCYYNVVGLSISKLYLMLKEMGVNL